MHLDISKQNKFIKVSRYIFENKINWKSIKLEHMDGPYVDYLTVLWLVDRLAEGKNFNLEHQKKQMVSALF